MTLTDEETLSIKKQLLSQLENFPENKRQQIEEQITAMTNEEIETFIKQNKLNHLGQQCVFCSIIAGQTPSYKIAEDKNYIAILELNPQTRGHSLIIPREHLEKIPESIKTITERTMAKIQKRLSPKDIKVNELKIMGHAFLELIPIYNDEQPKERRQASEEELKSIQEEILKIDKSSIAEDKTEEPIKQEEIPILPPRIP